MTWKGTKSRAEMRAEADAMLTQVQGFKRLLGGVYDGGYYKARITDRPGMPDGEAYALGLLRQPPADPEAFNCLVVEYFRA